MKEDKLIILPIIGFLLTLIFELFPSGVYRDWFAGADIVYPDGYGNLTGKPSVSLQHYVNNITEHLHVLLLYLYIFLNSREKHIFGIMFIAFFFSLLNYLYNNHQAILWSFDMNYIIGILMIILSTDKKVWKR